MIKRFSTIFIYAIISMAACMAAIEIPISADNPLDPDEPHNMNHIIRDIDQDLSVSYV